MKRFVQPKDFLRGYRFRSDTSSQQQYFTIMIIVIMVAWMVLWYLVS